MTPLTAAVAVLTAECVRNVSTPAPQPAAQLEKMAMADSAPWMYSALAQLRELEQRGAVRAGLGDLRIAQRTATTARLLLSLVNITDLPVPVVSPVSGGSISIVWSMGTKEVKFSCYPDGQAMCFRCEDDEVLEDGLVNLGAATSARTPLKWMVQPQR